MNRIREVRKQAGIKQIDLCARLGVSQGALSGWENGKYEPGSSGWLRLSEALGVSVDYLMGVSEEKKEMPTPDSEGERNVVRMAGRDGSYIVRRLSDEQYAAFKAILDQLPDASDDL